MLTVGGLFSGIGGWELGLEAAGMRIAWHCEREPYARAVLEKHWPGIPCYDDVCALSGADVEPVDVLCGGFPCQDISLAGRGAGIDGARSGLWAEYARLIGELRPRYVLVENVSALLARGLGRVLGDLAALGYDAEWDCLPASAFGAPHRRDRVWLVAYPGSEQHEGASDAERGATAEGLPQAVTYPLRAGLEGHGRPVGDAAQEPHAGREGTGERLADAASLRLERPRASRDGRTGSADGGRGGRDRADEGRAVDDAGSGRHRPPQEEVCAGRHSPFSAGWWATEPDVGRVANGVPARVDRLRCLGNAVVPPIPYWIGRRILEHEGCVN